jgi:hypothetical protein
MSDEVFDPVEHSDDQHCGSTGCPNVAKVFAYSGEDGEDGDYFCHACVTPSTSTQEAGSVSADRSTPGAALLEVLMCHGWKMGVRRCSCGWRPDDRIRQFPEPQQPPLFQQYAEHVAVEQERILADHVRRARAEALREADERIRLRRKQIVADANGFAWSLGVLTAMRAEMLTDRIETEETP